MDNLEKRLVEELDTRAGAQRAPAWAPAATLRRRARLRQAAFLTGSAVALATVFIASSAIVTQMRGSGEGRGSARLAAPPAGQAPEARRLFVVDPFRPNLTSRVTVVEPGPDGGRVVQTIAAGYDPAVEISPDGSIMYLAAYDDSAKADYLRAIDTTTGDVLAETRLSDRTRNPGITCCDLMSMSPESNLLYVSQTTDGDEGAREEFIAVYDTTEKEMLPESIPLDDCLAEGALTMIPQPGRDLIVVCPGTHEVRFVTVAESGAPADVEEVSLTLTDDTRTDPNGNPLDLWRIAGASVTADNGLLYVVTENGHVSVVDVASREVVEEHDLGLAADTSVHMPKVVVSPDGSHLYLGVGSTRDFNDLLADSVSAYTTVDWELEGSVEVPGAVTNLSVAPDGSQIFALSDAGSALHVYSAADYRRDGVIRGLGRQPQLVE